MDLLINLFHAAIVMESQKWNEAKVEPAADISQKIFLQYRKTLALESSFNTVASLKAFFYQKEIPTQVFFCEICEIFKSSFFKEHFWWLLLTRAWRRLEQKHERK